MLDQVRDHGRKVGDDRLPERSASGGRRVVGDLDQTGSLRQVGPGFVLVVPKHRGAEHDDEIVPQQGIVDRADAGRQHTPESMVTVGERQPIKRRCAPHGRV